MASPPGADSASDGSADPRPVLLITTVDIGNGRSATIEIRQGESAQGVSQAFCATYGLPLSVVAPLTEHLQEHLQRQQHTASPGDGSSAGSSSSAQRGAAGGHSVFHRLYAQGLATQRKLEQQREQRTREFEALPRESAAAACSGASRRLLGRRVEGFASGGERLYAEGLSALQRKQQTAEEWAAHKAAAEVAGATFKPQITKKAQQLKTLHAMAGAPKAWQQTTRQMSVRSLERIDLQRRLEADKELEGCTFKPRLNSCSKRIVMEKKLLCNLSGEEDSYEQLYQDAQRRHKKAQELAAVVPEELTFHPHLIASYHPAARGASGTSASWDNGDSWERLGGKKPVEQRLYEKWEAKERKLMQARRTVEGRIDPDTGRQRFRPATGREPAFQRNFAHLPVGDYLYRQGLEARERKVQQLRSSAMEQQQEAARKHTCTTSQALAQRLKRRRFAAIFEYLDTTGSGVVDLAALAGVEGGEPRALDGCAAALLDALDPAVKQDVQWAAQLVAKQQLPGAPGLVEGGLVDLDGFCGVLEVVLARHRGPRSYLVPTPNPKRRDDECTFKPVILERSKEMAARKRGEHPIHNLLYADAGMRCAQQVQRQQAAFKQEKQACPFKPSLTQDRLPLEGRALRMADALSSGSGASPRPCTAGPQLDAAALTPESKKFVELEGQVRQALDNLLGGRAAMEAGGEGSKATRCVEAMPEFAAWSEEDSGEEGEGDLVLELHDSIGLGALQKLAQTAAGDAIVRSSI